MTDASTEISVTAPPPTMERLWREAVDTYIAERSSELLTPHHLGEIRQRWRARRLPSQAPLKGGTP